MQTATRDGRSARWDAHRAARRRALVDAALAAIGRHGPTAAMDDIAAEAATSKTVLYRYFADREQLHVAVSARVAERLLAQLEAAISGLTRPRDVVAAAIGAYLEFIERDPAVYRFVVHQPFAATVDDPDPVAGLSRVIGEHATALVEARLEAAGRDTTPAAIWAHGFVGMVREAADHWLAQPERVPRAVLADQLTTFVWHGAEALLRPVADQPRSH